ncbi:hypothetical protein [Nocardia sp. NPDC058480]|uniref:hypothetical protein n=1 Tax=unclassified Nocardia TaxID=2637762 RepID=UPI00364CF2BE
MKRVLFVSVIAALAVLGAGCSDDSGSKTETTSKTTTTVKPTTTTAAHDEGHGDPGHVHTTAPAPGPNMMPNPNGDGTWVPCEGTICTNPNHGGGDPVETSEVGTPVQPTVVPTGPSDIVNPTSEKPPTSPGALVNPTIEKPPTSPGDIVAPTP